ncbi:LAME_0G16600g1_1 [Lachancea meyersii CBS 8951]|uniref:LAME_0G16600g1_1 n=1 Tax=Lachancea meyersii CBS 8951 TaxID=1266667 RepID=A0A1G4KB55_9SACH|nr:LAME_0G16600g1_1 [Lachancea meyersii CBS 8951]
MLHSRRSRQSKAIDSEAVAAAAAIGRALDQKGTKVDADKLPRYNSSSRSNSMVRSMSMSGRNNSLRSKRDSVRTSSLQTKKTRVRSSIDESEFFDAQDTFQQFGGPQAHTKPATVKKYVPGPTGLRLVEVPVADVQNPSSRRSSLTRRSPSTNSGLSSRNNSLRSDSLRRKSSLGSQSAETRNTVQNKVSARKKIEAPNSPLRSHNPRSNLVQQSLEEETDEQLQKERQNKDVVNPIVLPSSPRKSATSAPSHQVKTEKVNSKPVVLIAPFTAKPESPTPPSPPKVLISPPGEDLTETPEDSAVPEFRVTDTPSDSDSPVKTVEDVINEDKLTDEIPISKEIKSETSPEHGTAAPDKKDSGNSMAKYLRSANRYLNKAHEAARDEYSDASDNVTENGGKEAVVSSPASPPMARVTSPMKSALKQSLNNNSGNGTYSQDSNSTAHDAYVSLATAQNTRLNAQLSNEPPQRQPSVRRTRPQSMTNGNSRVPKKEDATRQKHRSVQALPKSDIQPPARSRMRPDSSSKKPVTKPGSHAKQQSRNDPSIFYPPEPPQKRSSFERVRPDQTHTGFKKLSLRDSMADGPSDTMPAGKMDISTPTKGKNPPASLSQQAPLSSGEKWSSRFQDSDSEDEGGPMPAPQQNATHSTGKSGVFSFKNKKDSLFEPPQPRYAQSATAPNSKHNTPNKKFSSLSLRSVSSSGNAMPAKTGNTLSNRFLSEQLPSGGSGNDEPVKKKSFGKKLKKLFGRKK